MAIMRITKDGESVLRVRAKEVPASQFGTPALKKLLQDMLETMYDANGVGIAAPQVGVSQRIFIAESSEGPIALINPTFTKTSWKQLRGEEGCLSVPGKFDKVKRFRSVNVSAFNANGQEVTFSADNFFARVLQHEMDHLDGKLYVDRVKEQRESDTAKK